MSILGLGYSVGTGGKVIEASVVVVRSFEELQARSAEIKGRIVVYNYDWIGYGKSVKYRSRGAAEASKHGAIAALIRSETGYSLNTPHTGMQSRSLASNLVD